MDNHLLGADRPAKPELDVRAPLAAFRNDVRVVCDLGYAYVDDGRRMFRIAIDHYAELLDACLSPLMAKVIQRYPSIFETVDSPALAAERLEQAHQWIGAPIIAPQ